MPRNNWLGPPSTRGLAPLAIAYKSNKGRWKFKQRELTRKQEKQHQNFQRAMKQADKEGSWQFNWE